MKIPSTANFSKDNLFSMEHNAPVGIKNVNVKTYWPFFTHSGKILYYYTGKQKNTAPLYAEIFYDAEKQCMCYKEYDVVDGKDVWRDSWFYRWDDTFGLAEWRDDYPINPPSPIWGDTKIVVLNPPIGWGTSNEKIGEDYHNSPQMSFLESRPPAGALGDQLVQFERVYDEYQNDHMAFANVLRMRYYQKWENSLGVFEQPKGAIYWFAAGKGPVTQQFLAVLPDGQTVYSDIYSATVKMIGWP